MVPPPPVRTLPPPGVAVPELRSPPQARATPAGTKTVGEVVEPRPRRVWPTALKWIRRIHLYSGIALLPWVLLYGVTALLFNHSSWLGADREFEVRETELRAAGFDELPSAETFAADAMRQLTARAGGAELALVAGSATWLGSLSFNASSGGADARLSIDPELRSGRLVVEGEPAPPGPAWAGPAAVDGWSPLSKEARATLVEDGREVAAALDVPLDSANIRRLPELRFKVRDGEREYVCDATFDGQVKVVAAESASSLRERLLRLHVQHGDPGYPGVRAIWALFVDAMGIAMVVWAVSGAVMWWSIRSTRVLGMAALLGGIVAMALLAVGLWRVMGVA
jgi:hypothetical protein